MYFPTSICEEGAPAPPTELPFKFPPSLAGCCVDELGCVRAPASVSTFLNQVSNFLTNFQFFFFNSTAARYYW